MNNRQVFILPLSYTELSPSFSFQFIFWNKALNLPCSPGKSWTCDPHPLLPSSLQATEFTDLYHNVEGCTIFFLFLFLLDYLSSSLLSILGLDDSLFWVEERLSCSVQGVWWCLYPRPATYQLNLFTVAYVTIQTVYRRCQISTGRKPILTETFTAPTLSVAHLHMFTCARR